MDIRDKKGTKNLVVDRLSRLELLECEMQQRIQINDSFLDEQLLAMSHSKFAP